MTPPAVDFWFEFASTYSYPAAMRIEALADAQGVRLRWRPFLLGPIFKAQGWDNSPFNIYPLKGRYMWRDLARVCEDLDLPFVQPAQFPQNGLLAARVALVGLDEGWGADFIRAVYRAQFVESRIISDPAVLQAILVSLRRDARTVFDRAQSAAIKTRLRENTEEAQQIGIFGAPSTVTTDGELFWGNDRLEAALAWAKAGQ
ncbi:MAG: 2-hydroxychromene-2-carboxylate isomerase [Pseudorhodoplanes sp.]|nr:2-hydroxychromene-2-carboxylate isomerase [Pseudorhodoplanes sp.]